MARRTLNRKDLRAQAEAAERLKQEEDETEEGDEEEDDLEDEADEEAGDEADEAGEEEAEVEEEKPVKKKKPAKAPAKTKSRARPAKTTRMKVVWAVFNNSNQRVATFDYPKRKDAADLAAKLSADKKNTHFVQPVKEPIEDK